jgi:hypothetical protein
MPLWPHTPKAAEYRLRIAVDCLVVYLCGHSIGCIYELRASDPYYLGGCTHPYLGDCIDPDLGGYIDPNFGGCIVPTTAATQ